MFKVEVNTKPKKSFGAMICKLAYKSPIWFILSVCSGRLGVCIFKIHTFTRQIGSKRVVAL